MFNTQRDRKKSPPEINSGEKRVETAGYIPPNEQIRRLMQAGENLMAWKRENYDWEPDEPIDDTYIDPTRAPGFDMADASQMNMESTARLEAQKLEEEEIKAWKEKNEKQQIPENKERVE